MTSFFHHDTWGADWGEFQLRFRWYGSIQPTGWYKDAWIWLLVLGPIEISSHRHMLVSWRWLKSQFTDKW